jgi:hypothetical protein
MLPVFPNGIDLRSSVDDAAGVESVAYRLHAAYPATEVVDFYNTWFYGNGWIPAHEECQRSWLREPAVENPEALPTWRYIASWINPQHDLSARVVLEYEEPKKSGSGLLTVSGKVWRGRN